MKLKDNINDMTYDSHNPTEFHTAVFPRDAKRNTFCMSAKSQKITEREKEMYQKNTPLTAVIYKR